MRLVVLSLTAFAVLGSLPALAAGNHESAKLNYTAFCASCHGKSGAGDGPMAATLSTHPRNFTNCDKMNNLSDGHILFVIENGGAGSNLSTEMPAWRSTFTDDQIQDLLQYLRGFCADSAKSDGARADAKHTR